MTPQTITLTHAGKERVLPRPAYKVFDVMSKSLDDMPDVPFKQLALIGTARCAHSWFEQQWASHYPTTKETCKLSHSEAKAGALAWLAFIEEIEKCRKHNV